MPSIRLFTSSTLPKQRLLFSAVQRSYHINTTTIYGRSIPLREKNSAVLHVYGPRAIDQKLWRSENVFSPRGHLDHIDRLRKKKPSEYEEWPRKERVRLPTRGDIKSDLEAHDRRRTLQLLAHLDGIENLLGYKFKSYEDVLLLLPRFPKRMKTYGNTYLPKASTLALLGEYVLQLATRDENQRYSLDEESLKTRGNAIGLYSFFIDQKTLDPLKPNKQHKRLFELYRGRERSRLSLIVPGIFGAVFRDGGINAVKSVINHTNFFPADQYASPAFSFSNIGLQKLGLSALAVLLINSLRGQFVTASQIKECMDVRRSVHWQNKVCDKPEVSQFIIMNNITKSSEGAPPESDPALRYRTFLGSCYRDGGLALVKDMLNHFEPGFSCPNYPPALQKRMVHYDQVSKVFWQTPT